MTRRLVLAVVSALFLTAAVRPWGSGFFAILAFVPLAAALDGEKRPLRAGLLAFVAWLGLGIPVLEGASLSIWWAGPALLAIFGAGWAFAGAGAAVMNRRAPSLLVTLPVLVTAVEFIASRRYLWNDVSIGLLGYTQADTPLRHFAAWTGTSGPAFAVAIVGCALYWAISGRRRAAAITAIVVAVALVVPVPGVTFATPIDTVRVGTVQTAQGMIRRLLAPYDDAMFEDVMDRFQGLTSAAAAQGAELVVWGETVLPEGGVEDALPQPVVSALNAAPVVLAGGVEVTEDGIFNSTFAWNGTGLAVVSRKQALVPVVESVYSIGEPVDPVSLQGARVAAFVCLDSLHGGLSRESVRRGAELVVYLTDDTFAGRTATVGYHLDTAILRAVETGRSVVFANEAGPSALIGPTGAVLAMSSSHEPATVVAGLPLLTGTTPYVALGDWAGAGAVGVALLLLLGALAKCGESHNRG